MLEKLTQEIIQQVNDGKSLSVAASVVARNLNICDLDTLAKEVKKDRLTSFVQGGDEYIAQARRAADSILYTEVKRMLK